jgi:hypothetical protein
MYVLIELAHFDLTELFVDEFETSFSLLNNVEEILFGLEKGNQFLFILGLLVGRQFRLDLSIQLVDICIFFADEGLDTISGLLQLHLDHIHVFYLALELGLGQFISFRFFFPTPADPSHLATYIA